MLRAQRAPYPTTRHAANAVIGSSFWQPINNRERELQQGNRDIEPYLLRFVFSTVITAFDFLFCILLSSVFTVSFSHINTLFLVQEIFCLCT